jgi:DNA-binding CsgD family transcriptional regulator
MEPENSLSPTEQQIIDHLREGKFDAEIAVRLGMTVGQAKARIETLMSRLGVWTREELLAWEPPAETAMDEAAAQQESAAPSFTPPATTRQPAEAEAPAPPASPGRRIPVARAGIVVATAVAGIIGIAAFAMDGTGQAQSDADRPGELSSPYFLD